MNYTGNKFKLLSQIKPLFPCNINTFVDLFAGGLDVSINVLDISKKVISNDIVYQIMELYGYFKNNDPDFILKTIKDRISFYMLDRNNKEAYLYFRDNVYNENKFVLDLYILLCHSFCNQISFNADGNFNETFGKRTFNPAIESRFIQFINRVHKLNFNNCHYIDFDFEQLTNNDFLYCDPPYLITQANYNKMWNQNEEKKCTSYLILLMIWV